VSRPGSPPRAGDPSSTAPSSTAAFEPALVGVVVPVRDEEQLLPACLGSLAVAVRAIEVPVCIVVSLDRCTDASQAVVERWAQAGLPVRAVTSPRPGVGAARAEGVRAVLEAASRGAHAARPDARAVSPERVWLATTDADSEVPPYWLARQLAHAARGAQAVIGTVRVTDWAEHPPGLAERFARSYRAEHGHRHLHGANLGFVAEEYLAVGGFAELDSDEDVDLVTRLEAAGSALVWAADLAVVTSARPVGRAPAGFAGYLSTLAESAVSEGGPAGIVGAEAPGAG